MLEANTALAESPEEQTATDRTSRRCTERGQVHPLGLQLVARDVVKILCIRADLLEQPPGSFNVPEVLLALIFPAACFSSPCSRQMRSRRDERWAIRIRGSGVGNQRWATSHGVRRIAPRGSEEFSRIADDERGGGEQACGGLDAAELGALDQPQAMAVDGLFLLTHQIEITVGSSHS